MKVSIEQVQKVVTYKTQGELDAAKADAAVIRLMNQDLIRNIVSAVEAMPDRDDLVADLKRRIEAGEYRPSGEDIADTMIRRAIADSVA